MPSRPFSSLSEAAYALLRIAAGAMFAFHGVQKIFGILADQQPAVGSQLWIGGVIELVGGALICVGLFARCAAFVASGQMAVAYFQFHWRLALDSKVFPGINGGELAVLYCFLFLLVACRGAGIWSLDRRRSRPSATS